MEIEIKDADIVRLQPGDILLVKTDRVINREVADRIKDLWRQAFEQAGIKGAVVVVQDAGMTASVLRQDDTLEAIAEDVRKLTNEVTQMNRVSHIA